jgi:hypothetical protein
MPAADVSIHLQASYPQTIVLAAGWLSPAPQAFPARECLRFFPYVVRRQPAALVWLAKSRPQWSFACSSLYPSRAHFSLHHTVVNQKGTIKGEGKEPGCSHVPFSPQMRRCQF